VGGGEVGGGDVGGGDVAGGDVGGGGGGGGGLVAVVTGRVDGVVRLRRVDGDVVPVVAGGALGAGAGARTAGAPVVVVVVEEVVVEDGAGRSTLTALTCVEAAGSVAVTRQATTATSATAVSTSSPFRKRSSGASR
jgi:hypothetical protein